MHGVLFLFLAVVGTGDVGETVVVDEPSAAESGQMDAALRRGLAGARGLVFEATDAESLDATRGWMGETLARPRPAPRWTPCRGRWYRYPVFPAEYYYQSYDYQTDFDYPWHKSPARPRGIPFHGAPALTASPTSPRPTRIEPIPMAP
ncbi:MAG: hypothetical protein JW809_13655 [Pirellulales bacterium]|nr:hypothetical protein [Pirellulales bacterium]